MSAVPVALVSTGGTSSPPVIVAVKCCSSAKAVPPAAKAAANANPVIVRRTCMLESSLAVTTVREHPGRDLSRASRCHGHSDLRDMRLAHGSASTTGKRYLGRVKSLPGWAILRHEQADGGGR